MDLRYNFKKKIICHCICAIQILLLIPLTHIYYVLKLTYVSIYLSNHSIQEFIFSIKYLLNIFFLIVRDKTVENTYMNLTYL